jgi:hypothetical protein
MSKAYRPWEEAGIGSVAYALNSSGNEQGYIWVYLRKSPGVDCAWARTAIPCLVQAFLRKAEVAEIWIDVVVQRLLPVL